MKNFLKASIAAALLGVLTLSSTASGLISAKAATAITTAPTGYTAAEQVEYEKAGKYVKNWGARGEDCTFLSTYAQSFYSQSTSFDSIALLSGGSSHRDAPQSALYSKLQSTMKSKHSYIITYDATRDLYKYTDCLKNDSTQISSFYSGATLNGTWDGGSTWNREHCWPRSKCINQDKKQDSADIMMLRPTSISENSSRGNKAYGESTGYQRVNDSVKGDCARVVLYGYVRWGNTKYMWGEGGVIENVDVLLSWMEADPVDTWEMGRNDAVQSIIGTRNIFVDYPEYAWLLFGREIPQTVTTPSGKATTWTPPEKDSASAEGSGSSENSGEQSSDDEEIPKFYTSSKQEETKGCKSSISLSFGCIAVALVGGYVLKRRMR